MVNRFMRKYRLDTVSDFSSPEALAALDCINDAKEEVLDSRSWQFDEREGVLNTVPVQPVTTVVLSNGSDVVAGNYASELIYGGTHTVRIVPTGSDDRSQTAHRLDTVVPLALSFVGFLSESYSGANVVNVAGNSHHMTMGIHRSNNCCR
jgi:hypothetical protein